MDDKELVWVEKEFAKKYQALEKDANKNAERLAVFNEYMETVKEKSREDFKTQLGSLEEDAAIYTGLMVQVKQSFEKAKNEQLEASYALWEKFEKEIPSIHDKIKTITDKLKPLQESITTLNDLWAKVNTWDMDKVVSTIKELSSLYGTQKDMVDFLVKNFKQKK